MHVGNLACQVCHAVEYKNCYNCHVHLDEHGTPYFTSDPSQLQLKVGRNPIPSAERPYDYAVLRHVPATPDIFGFYGEGLLPGFDEVPTWKYATPHNIQLKTPQNESCDACHGNRSLFLSEADLPPAELAANRGVVVPELPGPE